MPIFSAQKTDLHNSERPAIESRRFKSRGDYAFSASICRVVRCHGFAGGFGGGFVRARTAAEYESGSAADYEYCGGADSCDESEGVARVLFEDFGAAAGEAGVFFED
jgi:hypothetical protein